MVTRDIVQRLLNVINDTRRRVNTLESREYVLLNATQTLTNKTLTTPTIGDFSNAQHSHADAAGGGQLSLTAAVSGVLPPANGGTGVNNATRTLTIDTNSGTLAFSGAGYTLTIPETGTAVLVAATQTLTNKTLTTPTIGDYSNAQHSHADAAGGGQLSLTTAVSGVLPPANGGTGVNNDTRTLTINTNSGTLAFSGAGYTLTIPKTGTVPVGTGTAGRIAEWVTDANTVQASTLAKTGAGVLTLAAAANYTLTVPATGTAALLGTANVFTAAQGIEIPAAVALSLFNTSAPSASGGSFLGVGHKDTAASSSGDRLGGFLIAGMISAVSTSNSLGFVGYADGNWGVGDAPGRLEIQTTPPGQSARVTRLTIKSSGNIGIGTTLPSAQLHVDQSSTTGAKPTLRLRQADLSEEFIRFDTTVGAGNPINTTALGAYYGRVRVWVEGVGAKWLALYD